MDVATTHVNADADGIAALVALSLLEDPVVLVLPGSLDPTARRVWTDLCGSMPRVVGIRELRRLLEDMPAGRLLVVDAARLDRLGEIEPLAARFRSVLAWDTHPVEPGDLPRVDLPRTGACTSALVLRLRDAGLVPTPQQAGLFLVGIHVDTGHFTYPCTTPLDHEAAALCLAWGAPGDWPGYYSPRGFTAHQLHLMEQMAGSLQLIEVMGRTVAVLTLELDHYEPDLSVLLAQLREAEAWPAAFLVVATGGRIWAIGRSDGSLHVGHVLHALGGGGHRDAGSTAVPGASLRDALGMVMEAVRTELARGHRAIDAAVRTFVSVRTDQTIREAGDLMHRHRVNALPIERVDDGCRRFPGQVSRQEVDAALRHGLGDRNIMEISAQAPAWVLPDAPLPQARAALLSGPGRIVMVGEPPCDPLGVLTRTSVLRLVAEELPLASASRPPHRKVVEGVLAQSLEGAHLWVQQLGELAQELGMSLHLVGGCVRDVFIDRAARDVDLVTEGDAPRLARAALARFGGRVNEHEPFATARWHTPTGVVLDLATARSEFYAAPGALPEVRHAELRQDLYRRDFTINAVAIAVTPEEYGVVADPFGGLADLRSGVLRVLHGLSFHDDPTRAWRAARFAARFDFHLAADTASLMRAALRAGVIGKVTRERLGNEIEHILADRQVVQAFRLLRRWGLLEAIHPRLRVERRFLSGMVAAIEARQQLLGLRNPGRRTAQADVLWLHLAGALDPEDRAELARMVPGGRDRHRRWASGPERVARVLAGLGMAERPAEAGRQLDSLDATECVYALATAETARARDWVWWWERTGRTICAALDGQVLMARGVPRGPRVGLGLRAALDVARDGGDATRQLRAALEAAGSAPR